MSGDGSDKPININHQYHRTEDQVMMTEGHSFCFIDCDLTIVNKNDTLHCI